MTTEDQAPEMEQVTALTLKANVESLQVVDQPSFDASEALRATIKDAKKVATASVQEEIDDAHARHMRLCGIRSRIEAEYDVLDGDLKGKQRVYRDQQRKLAEEPARRQAEEARRQAEAKRKADAELLRAQGQQGAAKAVEQAPIPVSMPMTPINIPKVSGLRKHYSYRILDMKLFVQACWRGTDGMSMAFLQENEKALGAHVRNLKEQAVIPGVLVTCEER